MSQDYRYDKYNHGHGVIEYILHGHGDNPWNFIGHEYDHTFWTRISVNFNKGGYRDYYINPTYKFKIGDMVLGGKWIAHLRLLSDPVENWEKE